MPASESPKQFPEMSVTTSEDVRAWLASAVAEAAGLAPSAVDPQRPIAEFGLGSRQLVTLAAELSGRIGRPVEPSLVFDHPTIAALAAAVLGEGPVGAPTPVPRPRPYAATRTSPSSPWAAATPAAPTTPKRCGGCSPRARTPSPRCPRAVGTPGVSTTPTRRPPARRTPCAAASSATSTVSTRPSSGSHRARPRPWTPSSGCCSRPPGRRSSAPGSSRTR
nr:hypothetical protein HEP87_09020 [Streptomyces sp. S1D4-11]